MVTIRRARSLADERVRPSGPRHPAGGAVGRVDAAVAAFFTIAGVAMIAITEGRAGFRRVARRLVRWRVSLRWYAMAAAPLRTHTLTTRNQRSIQ